MSYSLETWARAASLFVEAGLPYEQVAGETGISIQMLKIKGREGKWTEKRRAFERQFVEINGKIQKLKVVLLDKALEKGDAQMVYALSTLISASARTGLNGKAEDQAATFIKFLERFIAYLQDKDAEALRQLQPHIRGFADVVKNEA